MTKDSEINTVRDLIDLMAGTRPDLDFLISPETGRVSTFKGLREQALHLCGRFRQLGLDRGDKIAFLMDNGLLTAQLFLGAMYGGFVSVPLNARAGLSQLSCMLDHCDAKVVFVGSQYDALIKEAMASVRRPVDVISADPDSCLQVNESSSTAGVLTPVGADDPALLMYSSGTTGQPKGAVHTHRSILAHGRNSACSHQLTAADRSLLVLPLYHINAECVTLIPTLTSGGSVVIPRGFVVSEFWNWLDDYHCTWSALVPTIISQLLDWKDPKAESRAACFQRIRFLRTSSAPLSPSLHHEFIEKFKLPLIQAMGSSEGGNVFSNPVPPGANKIGSPGLPWGFETRIIDRKGADIPIGEPGEVLLRGDGMMRGYYKDPAGTAAALDAEGWLHTGDLAYQDEDGYFFVVGRSKELIIKGGMNIAPKQIDEVLESYPAVLEAAAVGVPDRYVGEDVVAFAVLRDGMKCDEDELLSFCEGRLGNFKTPSRIHFVRDLPKGPSGKVQRLKLQEEAAERSVSAVATTGTIDRLASSMATATSSTPIEQIIAETWATLLKQPHVDPHSNFFSLGGHSLLAIQCLSLLRGKLPIRLSLADFFENATVAQQVALIRSRLRTDNLSSMDPTVSWEQELLQKAGPPAVDETIPPRDRSLPCPVSPNQRRIWFMQQLVGAAPVYNEAEAVRIRGELDVGALEKALNAIVARRENLRTAIKVVDGEPFAVAYDRWPVQFKQIDLSSLTSRQREAKVERLLVDEPRIPYHLEAQPGIRVTLLRLGQTDHVMILMMHHIVCDWASIGNFWRDLSTFYRAGCHGQRLELPALPIQHGDYAAWQRELLTRGEFAQDLEYWKENLRGAPALLDLPTDRSRPAVFSYRGAKRRFRIPRELTLAVRDCSRKEGVSLFTVFTAAVDTLLYRYSGQEDILLGIPLADRDRPELQSVIGFLLHTHVLRTQLSGDLSFRELLLRVQKGVLDLYTHRSPPFDEVVRTVQPERTLSHSPLFQVLLNWRDGDQRLSFIGLDGLEVEESVLADNRTAKFDLTLMLTDGGDSIDLEIEYSTDLFDEDRIERMAGHFNTLLEAAAANPGQRLSDLPWLTDAERQQVLIKWNQTAAAYPKDRCVHELVEEQVERTPNAIAVTFEDERLTYRQLNERANRLAHHLQRLGVGPDTLVALCVERSLEMVVGLLGILKAGGAYVPLDPSYPNDRLAFMLRDSGALLLLTHQRLRDQLESGSPNSKILCLDADWGTIAKSPSHSPKCGARSENLAYVIYTSGSTGEPKGVEIRHRNLANVLCAMAREPGFAPSDKLLAVTTLSFDIAALELFLPLVTGGQIDVAPTSELPDGLALRRRLELSGATVMQATPATWAMLIEAGWPGNRELRVLCGGEAIPPALAEGLLMRAKEVWNVYGPTETTIWSSFDRIRTGQPITIGRPIANTQCYVVDGLGNPVPIGVPGELLVGGDGLARGYFHRPELTSEKFVANPFSREPGARLYRTGDLVRRLPSGAVEYLGRLDHQVKIRSFRIELGEIESVLAQFPGVREAVVLAREDVPGEKRLVAYFSGEEDIPAAALRAHLERVLPEYMVPAAYVSLGALPLTPNGKLDRRALPAPGDHAFRTQAYEAPKGPIETAIAAIWTEFLHLQRVGRHDDFFKLGGHSLMALRVIGEINKTTKLRLHVPAFFQNPTLERLAKVLEQRHHVGSEPQVVQLQSGRTGLPLYLLGARPEDYRLARLLGGGRAIFVIDAPIPVEWYRTTTAVDRDTPPTMEQLGALYSDVLRAHAGSSPCVIAGYSLGGKIAFEAAHALQRAGGNVGLVLLVDAWAFTWSGATRGPVWHSLRRIWRGAASGTRSDPPYLARLSTSLADSWRLFLWLRARIPQMLKGRLHAVKNHFSPEAGPSGYLDRHGVPIDQTAIDRLVYVVGRAWRPRPLDALGVLFRTKTPNEELLPGYDFTNGWGGLFDRGLEIVQVTGDHRSMVVDENLRALARQINSVLDRYEIEHNAGMARSGDETDAGRSAWQPRSDQELLQREHAIY